MPDKPTPAELHAAERRADRVRALEDELTGYERAGKTERAEQVRAELKRAQREPKGRRSRRAQEA